MLKFINKFRKLINKLNKITNTIIIVPGCLGSGLFHSKGNFFYKKNETVFLVVDDSKKNATLENIYKFTWSYKDIALNGEGKSTDPDIGIARSVNFPSEIDREINNYGVALKYKNLICQLKNNFKEEVKLFNYDFRLDNETNSELLRKEIEKHDKVTLIGHSNGGVLIARAVIDMTKKGIDLDRISACFFIATPWKGTLIGLDSLLTGGVLVSDSFPEILMGFAREIFKHITQSFLTTYELMPSDIENYVTNSKNSKIQTDEFCEILKNRLDKTYKAQKCAIDEIKNNQDRLFLNSKFALDYLKCPIYSIIGNGIKTKSHCILTDKDFKITDYSINGDNTVLTSSSYPQDSVGIPLIRGDIKEFNLCHTDIQNNNVVIDYIKTKINENSKIFEDHE